MRRRRRGSTRDRTRRDLRWRRDRDPGAPAARRSERPRRAGTERRGGRCRPRGRRGGRHRRRLGRTRRRCRLGGPRSTASRRSSDPPRKRGPFSGWSVRRTARRRGGRGAAPASPAVADTAPDDGRPFHADQELRRDRPVVDGRCLLDDRSGREPTAGPAADAAPLSPPAASSARRAPSASPGRSAEPGDRPLPVRPADRSALSSGSPAGGRSARPCGPRPASPPCPTRPSGGRNGRDSTPRPAGAGDATGGTTVRRAPAPAASPIARTGGASRQRAALGPTGSRFVSTLAGHGDGGRGIAIAVLARRVVDDVVDVGDVGDVRDVDLAHVARARAVRRHVDLARREREPADRRTAADRHRHVARAPPTQPPAPAHRPAARRRCPGAQHQLLRT